jgi:hypothetical protein
MPQKRYKAEKIVAKVRQIDVLRWPREWSPERFGYGTRLAPPERKWKGWTARLSLAVPQRLQRNHNLSRLPPQQVFIAAEAIQGARRQICQAQEAADDIRFRIGAELVSLFGVGFLRRSQE